MTIRSSFFRFPFSIFRFPFSVFRFLLSVFYFPFSISCFPFPVSHFSSPVVCFPASRRGHPCFDKEISRCLFSLFVVHGADEKVEQSNTRKD